MRIINIVLTFLLICFTSVAFAQSEDIQDDFIPDFSADEDMKPMKAKAKDFTLSYGAWVTSMIIDDIREDSSGEQELMSSLTLAKVWLKTTFFQNFGIYARGKDTYLKVLEDTSEAVDDDNQLELDAAFLTWSMGDNMLQVNLGRKLYHIGTGIAFSGTGDGGEIGFYSKYINIEAFGAYTGFLNEDTNPYRLSDKDFDDGAKRTFYGGTLSHTIENQQIYILAVHQMDGGDDQSKTIKTKYNSQYYGAGLQGTFWSAMYYAEYIMEQGESYYYGSDEKSDIKASAGNFGLNYYMDIPFTPAILLGYSFASGDKDRIDVTSPNGNTLDDDENFLYFGKFVGGYALRPRLSNIHIYRAGFSFNPMGSVDNKMLNRMSIIFKYSYYKKDDKEGAISDAAAALPEEYIGDGFDLSLRWKIFYDFSVFVNYSLFRPGDAYYDDEENRTFLMGGANIML